MDRTLILNRHTDGQPAAIPTPTDRHTDTDRQSVHYMMMHRSISWSMGGRSVSQKVCFCQNAILSGCDVVVYHKFDITITMRNIGLGKFVEVKPLNEDVAVDLAANMLGELFVFAVGVGVLILEYRRQQRKDQAKEDEQNRRLLELESSIRELELSIETQSAMLREINRAFAAAHIKMPHPESSDLPKKITDPSSKTVLKVSSVTPAAT